MSGNDSDPERPSPGFDPPKWAIGVALVLAAVWGLGGAAENRPGPAGLILILVAGWAVLRRSASPAVGGSVPGAVQAELDRLRAGQAAQAAELRDVGDLLARLLPARERTHLRNLQQGAGANYRGNQDVRDSLRHLRELRLLTTDRPIGSIADEEVVNLHDFIRLTALGEQMASRAGAAGE